MIQKFIGSVLFCLLLTVGAFAQATEFTYQGRLMDSSFPANGSYDLEFKLFDVDTGSVELGTQTRSGVAVVNGIFTVTLDFGAQFDGTPRWLEIAVKPAGGPAFTPLTPRQPVTSAPHNIRSLKSADSDALGGLPPNGFIQNTTSPQIANFSISGNGTIGGDLNIGGLFSAPILNAGTQFNINGNRVLSVGGSQNVIVGQNAGLSNSGFGNTFVGHFAGNLNTTGSNNSFYGTDSGRSTSTGTGNSFFGRSSGFDNTTGASNSFFGLDAGRFNVIGSNNSFFGRDSGRNTTADGNSFFGRSAGLNNTTGFNNSFFGLDAGRLNTIGNYNSYFGYEAGEGNTAGLYNAFFGWAAGRQNQADGNAFFGAFAGESNTTGTHNAFFGSDAGAQNISGFQNSIFGKMAGMFNSSGSDNAFFGFGAGRGNTTGGRNTIIGSLAGHVLSASDNVFVGYDAGGENTNGNSNTFIGRSAGDTNVSGGSNTVVGSNADVGSDSLSFATAIGSGAVVTTSNTMVLGRSADDVRIPGNLLVVTLGSAGATPLCRNASLQIATCSSPFTENVETLLGALKEQKALIEQQQKRIDALMMLACEQNAKADICRVR